MKLEEPKNNLDLKISKSIVALFVIIIAIMFVSSLTSCDSYRGNKKETLKYFLNDTTTIQIYEIYESEDTIYHIESIRTLAKTCDSLENVIRIKNQYFNVLSVNIDSIIRARLKD